MPADAAAGGRDDSRALFQDVSRDNFFQRLLPDRADVCRQEEKAVQIGGEGVNAGPDGGEHALAEPAVVDVPDVFSAAGEQLRLDFLAAEARNDRDHMDLFGYTDADGAVQRAYPAHGEERLCDTHALGISGRQNYQTDFHRVASIQSDHSIVFPCLKITVYATISSNNGEAGAL